MTAADNILTSVADPNNLDLLKNSLNDQIKNTLENEFLGDYTFKLDDLIKSNEKYINPKEYNKRENVKKKNNWYNIKNQLNHLILLLIYHLKPRVQWVEQNCLIFTILNVY